MVVSLLHQRGCLEQSTEIEGLTVRHMHTNVLNTHTHTDTHAVTHTHMHTHAHTP